MKKDGSIEKHFSVPRVLSDVRRLCQDTQWCTHDGIWRAARWIAGRMKSFSGDLRVEIQEFSVDGKKVHGGWRMPMAWNVRSAQLKVVTEGHPHMVLADYRKNPWSLMMYSPPTPAGGMEGELVNIESVDMISPALRGKFVMLDVIERRPQATIRKLAQCGVRGLIYDHIESIRGIREGEYLDDATLYCNSIISFWRNPRIPGFVLTPRKGRVLRDLLKQGPVRLRAEVNSSLFKSTLPIVSVFLPGEEGEEIVLTAHMDEPGASDNASGVVATMELLRAAAKYSRESGKRLKRGLRAFFSVEVRGLQAWVNTQKAQKKIIGGLNIDMVGCDHEEGRTRLDVQDIPPEAPSYVGALLKDLALRMKNQPPVWKYRFREEMVVDDCQFALYPYEAPMGFLGQAPDRFYHTSLDQPECMSVPHFQKMGRFLSRAVQFMTNADYQDTMKLGRVIFKQALQELKEEGATSSQVLKRAQKQWAGLVRLLPMGPVFLTVEELKEMRKRKKFIRGHLYPAAAFRLEMEKWTCKILEKKVSVKEEPRPLTPLEKEADRMVPLKLFAGYHGLEDMTAEDFKKFPDGQEIGFQPRWGSPPWLQRTLDLSNGKRTLLEIFRSLPWHGKGGVLQLLVGVMKLLEKQGRVRFRVILEKKDVVRAVRRLGIRKGDIVMAHTSVSNFGYIRGGPTALLDALIEVVGPKGTLVMPSHSLSAMGNIPYDPRKSPSMVGAATTALLKRKDAIRSMHPTHSVVAIGPMAGKLVAGHDHRVSPQGKEGFWGNLVEANGKILMLCKLGSNTLLHAGDLWGGVPYPPGIVHFMRDGKRVEVRMEGMPMHVNGFYKTHDSLRRRGLLKTVRLGESEIHTMSSREAVETTMRLVRKNPLLATKEGCECRYCRYIRQKVAEREKGRTVSK